MGTDLNNVLDELEEFIEHLEYFAKLKNFEIDQEQLDMFANNFINLAVKINGEK